MSDIEEVKDRINRDVSIYLREKHLICAKWELQDKCEKINDDDCRIAPAGLDYEIYKRDATRWLWEKVANGTIEIPYGEIYDNIIDEIEFKYLNPQYR
jgi:hypothetical protein